MAQQLSETHPDAARVQLELLRKASVAQRLALTRSLTTSAIEMARRAIEQANPSMNRRDRDLLFIEYHKAGLVPSGR